MSLPAQGTAISTNAGPITLSELDAAIRKHVRTTRPLHRFSEGISSGPSPTLTGFDQNAIDSLVRGHKVAAAATAPHGAVPFSFDTSAQTMPTYSPAPTVRFKDQAIDEVTQMMEGLKLFRQTVVESTKAIREDLAARTGTKPLKTSFAKPRQPPSTGEGAGVVSASFEVSSMLGSSQAPNVRCFYCGLAGHYKDRCEILEQDILDGARVMIGRDRKLRWVVDDKKTGARVLGEEVKGHRDGARKNVVEVEADVSYMAALAKVDTSIVFESFSFGVAESGSRGVPTPAAPLLRFKPPPSEQDASVGVMSMDVVEITIPTPQDVTLEEALRVVNSLQFGRVGDGIPVSVICSEVALARQFGNTVDVQVAKRQRGFGDNGDQLGRVAIDWPPALGATTIYPRPVAENDPLGPSLDLSPPTVPVQTPAKVIPAPGTAAMRSTPRTITASVNLE
ncbi:hypothetical protein HDU67_002119 [Dinochytrium kinnereticum]|nr:hypothetical protein HDU67_002119 [Dinochytrium kinnereticum]